MCCFPSGPKQFSYRFFVGGTIHVAWSVSYVLANEICVVDKRGITAGVFGAGMNKRRKINIPSQILLNYI